MNKKGIIGLAIASIVIIVAGVSFVMYMNAGTEDDNSIGNENTGVIVDNNNDNDNNTIETSGENKNTLDSDNKTLVVYYSAQNHTKAVAEKVSQNLNADLFEIVPEEIYTSEDLNWTNSNSRVSLEHNDESLRDVKLITTEVDNWEDYDTVLIGYPIWWGIAAWPVDSFVKANDFNGKTVIPFCTSASSGLGQSGNLLEQEANGGNWSNGHRFNENPSDSDIKSGQIV